MDGGTEGEVEEGDRVELLRSALRHGNDTGEVVHFPSGAPNHCEVN